MIVIVVVCVFDIDLFIIHEIVTFVVAETAIVAAIAATFLLHSLVFRSSILEPHFNLRRKYNERVFISLSRKTLKSLQILVHKIFLWLITNDQVTTEQNANIRIRG